MASNYFDSLPPSFSSQASFGVAQKPLGSLDLANTPTSNFDGGFGVDKSGLDLPGLSGTGALASPKVTNGTSSQQPAWTFITAPSEISWSLANAANRVDVFGTNNPPVVAGSRGMRDVSIRDALVEGFIRNVQVEAKVAALEKLLEYNLNGSDGFVSVPVYQFYANSKVYGGLKGYYIIKDVSVKEEMRDLTGNAVRARVDINLMQVPEYQVNSGRDQASQVTAGGKVGSRADPQGVGTSKPAWGMNTPTPDVKVDKTGLAPSLSGKNALGTRKVGGSIF